MIPAMFLAPGKVPVGESRGAWGRRGGPVRNLLFAGCVGGGRRPIGRCRLLQRCRSPRVRRSGAPRRCAGVSGRPVSRTRQYACGYICMMVHINAILQKGSAVHASLMRPSMNRNEGAEMIHQLRIYEIFEQSKAAFHDRFRDHAARIMKSYGFEFVAMWEARTERRTEFVYLLAWPNEAMKTTAWARFMADEEWKEIKRVTSAKHGDLVGAIEERVLMATAYSPSPV